MLELPLPGLLALLLDDQLRRILYRATSRRRLRVRRRMECYEARDQQRQLGSGEYASFHRCCACKWPSADAAVSMAPLFAATTTITQTRNTTTASPSRFFV
ncbi:hypothetical protein BGV68_07130 [Burkholderia ubonensis]|nr:hypothetical protein BGV68_07130 [Burkholderia ubonensis]